MREIKVSSPKGEGARVAEVALARGAQSITIHSVFNAVRGEDIDEIKIKTSSPTARSIINALLQSPFYRPETFSLSTHDARSLVLNQDISILTRPFCLPPVEVYEDFWQASHITPSFICRVLISGMLLAYAMLESRFILMIGAMLFTVFSPPLMAIGLAISMREKRLLKQGVKAFLAANLITIAGATLVAWVAGGSSLVDDFGSLKGNLFIAAASAIVGAVADADDAGRRQLIAIAAAFPYARFPPWIGICCVMGFPDAHETLRRLTIFGSNILVMIFCAALTYRLLHMRPQKNNRPA